MSELAPSPLGLGSPSGALALRHCDALPESAAADRSAPTAPVFWHRADHLSSDSPRSSARYAHAPRSLHVLTRLGSDLPTVNASPFPTRSGCAAVLRTLLSWPLRSYSASVPATLPLRRPERNTSSSDRPDPIRWSASDPENSSAAFPLRCYSSS